MTGAVIVTWLETIRYSTGMISSGVQGAAMFGPSNHFYLIYFCT
jgi:hypothetical protein